MNVIIIAAIAILILVVLVVLVMNSFGGVTEGTSCTGVSGRCADSCEDFDDGIYAPIPGKGGKSGGCSEEQVCCKRIIETGNE
jgi:hypothetical protein